MGPVAKLVQGLAHLGVDVLRALEVGEGVIEYLYDVVDVHAVRLVSEGSGAEGVGEHLLDAADALETAVLGDDALVVGLVEPVAVAP